MRHAFYALVVAMFALSALATPSGCSNNGPPGSVSGAGGNGVDASNVTADANGAGGRVAAIGDAAVDGVAGGKGLEAGTDGSADVAASDGSAVHDGTAEAGSEGRSIDAADAGTDSGGGASAAMIKAGCGMYAAGTKAMTAVDFCTLFQATCDDYIDYEPLTGCAADPVLWAPTYDGWTMSQKDCRSQQLCEAAMGSASGHCHSAQGFGGTCM
jgi:hypothetical protein